MSCYEIIMSNHSFWKHICGFDFHSTYSNYVYGDNSFQHGDITSQLNCLSLHYNDRANQIEDSKEHSSVNGWRQHYLETLDINYIRVYILVAISVCHKIAIKHALPNHKWVYICIHFFLVSSSSTSASHIIFILWEHVYTKATFIFAGCNI